MLTTLPATLAAIASIFGLSFFHFWSAIPAGLTLGLAPVLVIFTVCVSYALGAALVLFFGERARDWVQRRWNIQPPAGDSRIVRIWERWGVIGFGLIAPMTLGAQLGAMIGLMLGAEARRLFVWMMIGAIVWAVGITIAILLGVDIVAG